MAFKDPEPTPPAPDKAVVDELSEALMLCHAALAKAAPYVEPIALKKSAAGDKAVGDLSYIFKALDTIHALFEKYKTPSLH